MKNTDNTLTQKEEQGIQSRRYILDAALDLMARLGYAAASISAISKQSGLPVSSIYWHFESKEGLLVAVLEDGARNFVQGLPKFVELSGSREERLSLVLEELARRLAKQPRFLRLLILMALEHRHTDSPVLSSIQEIRNQVIDNTAAAFSAAMLPTDYPAKDELSRQLSLYMLVVADGAFIAHQIDPTVNLEELFSLQLRAVLALLPPENGRSKHKNNIDEE